MIKMTKKNISTKQVIIKLYIETNIDQCKLDIDKLDWFKKQWVKKERILLDNVNREEGKDVGFDLNKYRAFEIDLN